MSKVNKKVLPRREFLKTAGVVGAVAGAAMVVKDKPAKAKNMKIDGHAGYQETDHVKTYYELARF